MKLALPAPGALGAAFTGALCTMALVVLSAPSPGVAGPASPRGGSLTPNATQPPLTFELLQPGGNCANCHGDYDFRPTPIEPYVTWSGSMMANAGRDPLFWAALDVANNDIPGVGAFCLRCHSPRAWLEGRVEGVGGSPDGCSLIGQIDQPDNDFSGVACHLCHRMMENPNPPNGEQSLYLENGQYWLDDEECFTGAGEACRRGPYLYPQDGDTAPPHPWAHSPLHESSDFCGNCHNVTSPAKTLLVDGVDTGVPYPIERTYREWTQSNFALGPGVETCQNCHMPDPGIEGQWACVDNYFVPGNDHTGDLPVHQLAGGNTWIPDVLRGDYPMLFRDAEFQQTRDWALEMLQDHSAVVTVDTSADFTLGGNAEVTVRVTNITGHKLPTGYTEGRRMWLAVTATDDDGAELFSSGSYDFATGDLTEDAQIKIYQSLPGIWNSNGTDQCDHVDDNTGKQFFHFALNDCIVSDTRIPPAGFTGGQDPETRPVAYVYPETFEGSGILVNHDDTTYQWPVPIDAKLPITVDVTLYYQTASKEYFEFLRDEAIENNFPDDCIERTSGFPTMSRGEIVYDMWERYDRAPPVTMEEVTALVGTSIFDDGFENGDRNAWSSSSP